MGRRTLRWIRRRLQDLVQRSILGFSVGGALRILAMVAQYGGAPAAAYLVYLEAGGWAVACIVAAIVGGAYNQILPAAISEDERTQKIQTALNSTNTAAIRLLNGYHSTHDAGPDDLREPREVILHGVQLATAKITQAPPNDPHFISANLMVPTQGGEALEIERFDQLHAGRRFISIPVDRGDPGPGAASAFVNGTEQYIPNITAPEYSEVFRDNAPYRCVLSLPILDDRRNSLAVVNVDAVEIDFFNRGEKDWESLAQSLQPITSLMGLALDDVV